MPDKYSAVWLSHSSISDFLACPRSYFLKNVYKDPKTNRKVQVVNPALSLGSIVHQVLEALSVLPIDKRFSTPLLKTFNKAWQQVSGIAGGFVDTATENEYKKRGQDMLDMVTKNPGILKKLAVKIKEDLPYFWLSEVDNLILCGKVDWLEYQKDTDSVHIVDFKTGRHQQKEDSLQLPIYHLLVSNCQTRPVSKASYWYLENGPDLSPQKLPDLADSAQRILKIGKKIKLARQLNHFSCPKGDNGCLHCRSFEQIVKGKAKYVGTSNFRDNYLVNPDNIQPDKQSVIL